MGLSPARRLAFKVIKRVREKQSYAAEAMQSALVGANIDPRDKAFATRLAYGTIATRGTLDQLVATELSKPEATPDDLKDALALAAYELFFEKTEAYVVVNQGVELAYFATNSKTYRGLANAVLRRLSEKREKLFPGGDPETDLNAAATLYGHPLWLARLMEDQYGAKRAREMMATNNEPAPLYVAQLPFLRSEKQSLAALEAAKVGYKSAGVEGAYQILDQAKFWAMPAELRASFVAMDLAAQQVVDLVKAQPDQQLLEVGSGRGTKSLVMAAGARRRGGPAQIVGLDLYEFKNQVALRTAQSYGVREARYLTIDVKKQSAYERLEKGLLTGGVRPSFDSVLIDAPCSGLGTLRRGADKRWKLSPDDLIALAKLGSRMISWSAALVKPGGRLFYATCTIATVENQSVIERFLATAAGKEYEVEPFTESEVAPPFVDALGKDGFLNILPSSGGPDGHFCARLKRKG
ncbi:MAG: hypothetical protein FWE46_00770 [Coriobacteriia bacterium]|nr:hypothetical protein [Coriobacteriia bacterium]MCL2537155.1 hypothetical protein [Coriobacteriia bacterium]